MVFYGSLIHITALSLLLFQMCFTPGQSQIVPSIISNYNQPCTQASQCNNNAGLYCIPSSSSSGQSKCGCPTNSTTFDEYQGRCVGKVNFPCVYQGNQSFCPDKAHCSHQNPHNPDLYFYESRCFCDANYFADKNGKCILAAKYAEPCAATGKKCDEVSGLKCIKNYCACALGIDQQYYDAKKDKCVSYIFKNCTGFNSCPENARCDGISINRAKIENSSNSNESPKVRIPRQVSRTGNAFTGLVQTGRFISNPNAGKKNTGQNLELTKETRRHNTDEETEKNVNFGQCICNYGFTSTKQGKCLAGYKQSCSKVQKCNHEDNLECLDGSCNCKSPLHQVFDHSSKKCVNLVGAKCDSKVIPSSCVPNAHCINGICACKSGFSRTPYRQCMLGYGKLCDASEKNCNYYNGLACKNSNSSNDNNGRSGGAKKCSCVDDSLNYNTQFEACVGGIGSPCGRIGSAGEYGKEFFYVSCEPLAICKEESNGDKNTRFCRLPNKDL